MNIPDRLLFGQFLVERKKLKKEILYAALKKQESENITSHHRMLGNILLHDHGIFEDRVELYNFLNEFEKYKNELRKIYIDAKIYGMDAEDKLKDEYADLMEELETAPTTKIRDLIIVIEKFKIAIKEYKEKNKEMLLLKENIKKQLKDKDSEITNLNIEITSLRRQIEELQSKRSQELKRIDDYVKKLKNKNN